MDEHLGTCDECRQWYFRAREETQLLRKLAGQERPPLTTVTEASAATRRRPTGGSPLRWALGAVGLVQVALAGLQAAGVAVGVPMGLHDAHAPMMSGHLLNESTAWSMALGVAMIVADNVDEEHMGATLGEDNDVKIPAVGVTKADGARLRAQPGPATVRVEATTKTVTARNVIAQTTTGSTQDVVMVGAHLDSVPEGPGINDNGSGVAAVLETALQLGDSPQVHNAVRFGFWGAEELGLIGSRKYVESLDVEQLKNIALYLNFDMLGSPNPGYFTYDGDQSLPADKRGQPVVPEGSAGIERTLVGYLKSAGKEPQDTSFDGRSDYDGFTQAGIPSGGLFSGAEVKKSADEAKLWGGTADEPFDPNYHKATDTLDHVDRDCLGIQGGGVAFAVGLYAQDISGRNGVPVRDDRTRHLITES